METQASHCFRLRPSFRNVGIASTVFNSTIGLASVLGAYFNVDGSFPRPHLAAAVFGVFWSIFVLLGVWLWLLYYRYRLVCDATTIRQCGVITDRAISLQLVHELKWRRFPVGGSVKMSAPNASLKIELGNFGTSDRAQLISMLRSCVAPDRQVGWTEFCQQFEDTPRRLAQSRRRQRFLVLFLVFNAIVFVVLGLRGLGVPYVVLGLVNALTAGYLIRFRDRSTGADLPGDGKAVDERDSP